MSTRKWMVLLVAVAAVSVAVPAFAGPAAHPAKKKAKRGPKGPAGPAGATGPQGPPGPTGTITERDGSSVSVTDPDADGGTNTATATCQAGEVSISGGGTMQAIPDVTSINNSHRNGTDGWTVTGWNNSGSSVNLIPHVTCLKVS